MKFAEIVTLMLLHTWPLLDNVTQTFFCPVMDRFGTKISHNRDRKEAMLQAFHH